MPTTASDRSATITVVPAKTTAPPDVAVARATDSSVASPPRRCSWWRVTMNSAQSIPTPSPIKLANVSSQVGVGRERGDRVGDRLAGGVVGDLLAGGRGQHPRVAAVGLLREPRREQVGGLLAAAAGEREVVAGVRAGAARQDRERGDDHDP